MGSCFTSFLLLPNFEIKILLGISCKCVWLADGWAESSQRGKVGRDLGRLQLVSWCGRVAGGGKNTIAVAEETLSLQQHGSSKTLHDTQVSSGSGTRFSLQQASAPTAQSRGPLRKGGTWIPRGDAAQPRPYPACYVAGLPRGTLPRGDLPHGDQQTTGSDHPSSQSAGGAERDTDIARSAGVACQQY